MHDNPIHTFFQILVGNLPDQLNLGGYRWFEVALYWVLLESVELRQAPFVGWIQNLTAPDPYYVLPVLNGLVMLATQFLTPTAGMDPTQAKMMKVMPVVFAVMFAFFPAGLVLYYVVNGGLSLLQQWIITRRMEARDKARA